jgi:XTP/dITP diphosphohydrolase
VGFEWDNIADVWAKVQEELEEFKEVVAVADQDKMEDECGDLLFSLVNYSRFLNIDPETALERTNQKFLNRFRYIEEVAQSQGKQLTDMTLREMDAIWNEAKSKLPASNV